jgi:Amidase
MQKRLHHGRLGDGAAVSQAIPRRLLVVPKRERDFRAWPPERRTSDGRPRVALRGMWEPLRRAGSPALIGQERVMHLGEEIEFRELVMNYTVPQDLIGLPACTIRAGFDALGVPTAVQLTGPAWSEWRVLSAAQALFDATENVQLIWPDLPATASTL